MKTAPNLKVVHESEVQRQHVRLPMPVRVKIDDREYPVRNFSSAGLAILNITGDFERGERIRMQLRIPLNGFSMDMEVNADACYYDAGRKTLGCAFTDLSSEQISLLNHVLKAFIAGELVTSGNILNVAARNNFAISRLEQKPANESGFARQLPGLATVAIVGFLIVFFIAGNLYSNIFFVKSTNAVVNGPVLEVRAAAEGIYHARLDPGLATVMPDQLIGTITPSDGQKPIPVISSCNCYIVKSAGVDGQFVSAGASLISLIPVDAKPWVTVEIDSTHGAKLGPETAVTIIAFGSSVRYSGHIASVESNMSRAGTVAESATVTMRIVPDRELPVDLVNRPATVMFSLYSTPKIKIPAFDLPEFDLSQYFDRR